MSAAEQVDQQYPGLLDGLKYVESRGNPNAINPRTGAAGQYGLMAATAAHYGVDPHNPAQAREAAAQNVLEGLKWSGGDVEGAMRYYQGGPNMKGWGKENAAYPGLVMAAINRGRGGQPAPQASGGNDLESIVSGKPSAPPPAAKETLESIVGNAMPATDAPLPNVAANNAGDPNRSDGGSHYRNDLGRNGLGDAAGDNSGAGSLGARGAPVQRRPDGQPDGSNPQGWQDGSFVHGLDNFFGGAASGVGNVLGTGAMGIGWGLDKLGVTTGAVDKIARDNVAAQARLSGDIPNPEGYAAGAGRLAGNIAATSPLAALKVFGEAPEASALVRGLGKYGNYAVQGGAAGAAMSGGHDVLADTIVGAGLGPVGGAVGEHIIGPVVGRIAQTPVGQRLAAAIRGAAPEAAGEVAPAAEASAQTIRRGNGLTNEQIRQADNAANPDFGKVDATGATDMGTIVGGPDLNMAAALKAHAARNGIEATQQLPAKVADHVAELKASGVPDDHALNEASIHYVGGNPTVGAVTRNRAAMQAEKEGAKVTSPEGSALAARAAENNAALHDTVQETVNGYGGIPQEGTATQGAAKSLAKVRDAEQAKVTEAYTAARATDGDQRVGIDPLTNLLSTPDYKFAVTGEGRQLVSGLRGQIKAMSEANGGQFSPEEIDKLTQSANRAYSPMGGGANHMIGEIKDALNKSLDQFDNAGDAFNYARGLHRGVMEKYSDPAGIAKLIERDAQGNFTNEGGWRAAEGKLIGGAATDKAFGQVVRQLQANGDTQALDHLKAQVVQGAYQRSMGTAADELGNPVFSAKQWHNELNKIGMGSLETLFSKDEIAHLATVGRAARALHESVPGTVNGPGTSAALINALSGAKNGKEIGHVASALGKALKVGGHVVSSTIPMGHVAVEGVAHVAGKVSGARSTAAANKTLAKAIRETLDPAAARAAANENTVSAAAKSSRKDLARGLARHTAPAAAASQRNR